MTLDDSGYKEVTIAKICEYFTFACRGVNGYTGISNGIANGIEVYVDAEK